MTDAQCLDCGLPYGAFPLDVNLPRAQWLAIHPDEGGLLCASCIVKRAAKIPGATVAHLIIEVTPAPIVPGLSDLRDQLTRATATIARLEVALQKYGQHEAGCPTIADDESDDVLYDYLECACGFTKALGAGRAQAPRENGLASASASEPPSFHYRTLATMLAHLATHMKGIGRVSVPKTNRHHGLVGWDQFTPDDVETALLEAERLARMSESRSPDGDGQHGNGRAAGELGGGDVRTVHAPSGLESSQVRTATGLRTGARHEDGIQGQPMKPAAGSEPADSHHPTPSRSVSKRLAIQRGEKPDVGLASASASEELTAALLLKAEEAKAATLEAKRVNDSAGVEYHDGRASAYQGAIAMIQALRTGGRSIFKQDP